LAAEFAFGVCFALVAGFAFGLIGSFFGVAVVFLEADFFVVTFDLVVTFGLAVAFGLAAAFFFLGAGFKMAVAFAGLSFFFAPRVLSREDRRDGVTGVFFLGAMDLHKNRIRYQDRPVGVQMALII
jgi:hypothetical protein